MSGSNTRYFNKLYTPSQQDQPTAKVSNNNQSLVKHPRKVTPILSELCTVKIFCISEREQDGRARLQSVTVYPTSVIAGTCRCFYSVRVRRCVMLLSSSNRLQPCSRVITMATACTTLATHWHSSTFHLLPLRSFPESELVHNHTAPRFSL